MPTVAIVTDSTSDLPGQLASELGVTVVPLVLTLDGQTYRDGVDIGPDDFYHRLERSGGTATTSQPSIGEFSAVYEKLLRDHEQVLSLHLSGTLSGTVESARQAAEMVGGGRVTVVDTRFVSMALALARAALMLPASLLNKGLARLPGRKYSSGRGTKLHDAARAILNRDA
ncbi:MAG: DegV family protein, partial [Candidatus Dormibacteraceae bacterium]